MGVMYGKAHVDDIWEFWQAEDFAETEWGCYQFEYEDDDEPIFSAFVTEQEDGTWTGEINPRYPVPTAHSGRFPDCEAAMQWCSSWSFCPERGQGEHEYPELTLSSEVVRDLVRMSEHRQRLLENGSTIVAWTEQAIADTVRNEVFAKCAHVYELPERVREAVREALADELSKTHTGADLEKEMAYASFSHLCDIEGIVPTSVIVDLLKEHNPRPRV